MKEREGWNHKKTRECEHGLCELEEALPTMFRTKAKWPRTKAQFVFVPWALRDAETTGSLERVSKTLQPGLWEDLALWGLGAAWPVVTVLL